MSADTDDERIARENHAKSRAEAERLNARRDAEHAQLVASGRAINVKAAHARCFAAGTHGHEALRGGFD